MTTADIEQAADRGDIATGDMNLKQILRRCIVPQFLEDCGRVGWRKKTATLSLTIHSQTVDLPNDFLEANGVYVPPNYKDSIKFIGDDSGRQAQAEANTVESSPTAYYIVQKSGPGAWKTIKFDAPADKAYTLSLVYYNYGYFADDTTSVDMQITIPEQYHWALVEGLRTQIFLDRFGQGDKRYVASQALYQGWVGKAGTRRELGQRNHQVFVR